MSLKDSTTTNRPVYQNVSQSAIPPNDNLFMFVDDYLVPKMNLEVIRPDFESGKMGFFEIQFIVEKDGTISSIEVLTSVGPNIDAEIVRVLSESVWTPAKNRSEVVRQLMILDTYFAY